MDIFESPAAVGLSVFLRRSPLDGLLPLLEPNFNAWQNFTL